MKVLLDECVPRRFKNGLIGHDCQTVPEAGFAGKKNGELLSLAEASRFEVFLTVDHGIPYQQNLAGRKIAIILVRAKSNQLADCCLTPMLVFGLSDRSNLAKFKPSVDAYLAEPKMSRELRSSHSSQQAVLNGHPPCFLVGKSESAPLQLESGQLRHFTSCNPLEVTLQSRDVVEDTFKPFLLAFPSAERGALLSGELLVYLFEWLCDPLDRCPEFGTGNARRRNPNRRPSRSRRHRRPRPRADSRPRDARPRINRERKEAL